MANDEMLVQIMDMIKGISDELSSFKDDMLSFKDEVNSRFDKVDERFDGVDTRLDKVEVRLDRIENQVNENYNAIETLMYDQKDMRKDITAIQLRIENKVDKSLSILAEAARSDSDRLHDLESRMQASEDNYVIDEVIQGLKERKLI